MCAISKLNIYLLYMYFVQDLIYQDGCHGNRNQSISSNESVISKELIYAIPINAKSLLVLTESSKTVYTDIQTDILICSIFNV